jgi:hypothetical protein
MNTNTKYWITTGIGALGLFAQQYQTVQPHDAQGWTQVALSTLFGIGGVAGVAAYSPTSGTRRPPQ